jgi:Domain of unknown function (DUF4389)
MNDSAYPIRLVVTGDLRRSRLTVFFRYLLALPHLVWVSLYGIAAYVVLLVAWFAALFMGRVPGGMHGFIAGYLRYSTRVNAYLYLVAKRVERGPIRISGDPRGGASAWPRAIAHPHTVPFAKQRARLATSRP